MSVREPPRHGSEPSGPATSAERDVAEAEQIATMPPGKQMDNMAAAVATATKKITAKKKKRPA